MNAKPSAYLVRQCERSQIEKQKRNFSQRENSFLSFFFIVSTSKRYYFKFAFRFYLPVKSVRRTMIDVTLLGCGGVMPLPGRALTSLFVRYNGKAILIDCGEGTQIELRRNKSKYSQIDAIFLTHLHGDHILGIPGLLLSFGLNERTAPLKIYGPSGIKEIVKTYSLVAPNLPFEIICEELTESEIALNEIGLNISAFKVKHSVDCYGYRIDLLRSPKFDPKKARALNIPIEYFCMRCYNCFNIIKERRHQDFLYLRQFNFTNI